MDLPESKPAADAPPVVQKISSWSFSRLVEDFEVCPYKAKLLYVDKRPRPEATKGEALLRGIRVHEGAEKFIKGETDELVPELGKAAQVMNEYRALYQTGVVEVEQNWAFDRDWQRSEWFAKDCWLRLKLDVFVNGGNTAEVIDVKTGKKFGNEVKHSQQGILYALCGMLRYPEIEKASIKFVYVDHPRSTDTCKVYDRATIMRMMPSWNTRARAMTEATEFPAKPSKIACRYCAFGPNNGGDKSCPWGVEV